MNRLQKNILPSLTGRGWWRVLWGCVLLSLFLFLFPSCGDDPATPPSEDSRLPQITWVMSSGRFRIQAGESIQLVPDIENLDETSVYVWTIEGEVVGHDNYYTFTTDTPGEYFVKLTMERWKTK